MRGFAPGGAAAFAAIPGIELAAAQSLRPLRGRVSDPAGVDFGASGAPVLDGEGKAVGIVVRRLALDDQEGAMWRVRVPVGGGDPFVAVPPGGRAARREVRLPERSMAYVEPLSDPAALHRLGPAAQGVEILPAPDRRAVRAVIPALPGSACVVFRGELAPY